MANASRLQRADDETVESLVAKCQENGWLKRGGYAWQDDPYLEEYPYEFAKADGGDEWWTLKSDGSDWIDFESWSFNDIVKEPERFAHAIECMHRATPEQCKRLDYMSAIPSIEDAARRARDSIPQLNKTANPHSRNARAEVR